MRVWLAIYNQILGLGWLYVLTYMCSQMLVSGTDSFHHTWADVGSVVTGLQLLVLFDILHAACGLWPPDPSVGMLQRLWCKVGHRSELFVTIWLIGAAVHHWSAGPLVLTWAIADVSRYQLYFLRSLDRKPPQWLRWLRYSDFILQYPLNILAEAYFVYCALPHLARCGLGWLHYGPVAAGFQLYEWIIFVPAFRTLWKIRGRRLKVPSNDTDHCKYTACNTHLGVALA